MHEMGIYKGKDLYEKSEMDLIREFGKMGYSLYRKVRGIHDIPVEPNRDRNLLAVKIHFLSRYSLKTK